ncbi:hypothetical protein [Nocardia vinacea]|uniref:hypothetical protein n=1 Tax=Nocardia vinacea TaxID=96468 RepID=UPI00030DF142|nr:hypothetical protein [Nocardia vinacea]
MGSIRSGAAAVTAAAQARFRYAVLAAHLPVVEGITVVGASTMREVLDCCTAPPTCRPESAAAVVSRDINGL